MMHAAFPFFSAIIYIGRNSAVKVSLGKDFRVAKQNTAAFALAILYGNRSADYNVAHIVGAHLPELVVAANAASKNVWLSSFGHPVLLFFF